MTDARTDRTTIATTVRVPPAIWQALRRLAEERALQHGARPSVSATVVELVEAEERRRREASGDRA